MPVLPSTRHVNRGAEREQSLVGADVGSGALAFDVLLAGGQRQHVGALAAVVHGLADETSRHFVNVGFLRGEEAERRAAVPHRESQRLAFADHDVRAHFAGRLEHGQRGRVGDHADQRALAVRGFDQFGVIVDAPEEIGILDDDETGVVVNQTGQTLRDSASRSGRWHLPRPFPRPCPACTCG